MPRNTSAEELGLKIGTIVKVEKKDRSYAALTIAGEDIADRIESYALKNAHRSKKALVLVETKNGTAWRQVSLSQFEKTRLGQAVSDTGNSELNIAGNSEYSDFESHEELKDFIADSFSLKPQKLKISEVAWKYAVRTVIRGRNMLVVGPSGCGKTLLANALKVALGKEDKFFYINLGATQDPRSTLIGNTHFNKENGTYVSLSYFAKAIQVPGALILLDEASRAHPDAHNILMPILDYTQRYLRVDEKDDSPTINVASGVSFILTANVGSEYTATRTMDRALLDRCIMFEMQPLDEAQELENLQEQFPSVNKRYLVAIAKIATATRKEVRSENPRLDTIISTRMSEELAGCINDGMSLAESAEMCIYPYFSDAGGADSPRSQIRIIVQKELPTDLDETAAPFKSTPNKNSDLNNGRQKPW